MQPNFKSGERENSWEDVCETKLSLPRELTPPLSNQSPPEFISLYFYYPSNVPCCRNLAHTWNTDIW